MKISTRGSVSPFLVMEALREARDHASKGVDIIHLSLGQPGRAAPERVIEKAAELLRSEVLGYTDACGLPELRARISKYYQDNYKLDVPAESIFITVGASSASFMSMLAAFDPGDEVAITLPAYPAYPNMLEALNLKPVFLRGDERSNFQPTVSMLEALPRPPAGLIIASPSNPAGTVIPTSEFEAIIRYAEQHKIRLISDEIYHNITYGAQTASVLEFTKRAIVVNSFSKYFLMPGWRLGWAVIPKDLQRSFESLLQNFFISPPALAQHAGLEVFECEDELRDVVHGYARNRAIMLEELPKAGIDRLAPAEGGFYVYANVSNLTNDSKEFCSKMMAETGVVAIPGRDFDRENGHAYVRFSFAGTEESVREAMLRLQKWLKK